MGQPGFTVMLNQLAGNRETVTDLTAALGKEISALRLEEEALHLEFTDKSKIKFFDGGQSCCEMRYMRTDDTLDFYVGSKLMGAEIKEAPSVPGEYDEHEVQFLEIVTSKGVFTMSSHNEHNGYYGGFSIQVRAE